MLLHVLRSQLSLMIRAACPSRSVCVVIESSSMDVVVISSSESDRDDSAASPSSPGSLYVFTPTKCPLYPYSSESRLVFETLKERGFLWHLCHCIYLRIIPSVNLNLMMKPLWPVFVGKGMAMIAPFHLCLSLITVISMIQSNIGILWVSSVCYCLRDLQDLDLAISCIYSA